MRYAVIFQLRLIGQLWHERLLARTLGPERTSWSRATQAIDKRRPTNLTH
jgi:hypothetical protein